MENGEGEGDLQNMRQGGDLCSISACVCVCPCGCLATAQLTAAAAVCVHNFYWNSTSTRLDFGFVIRCSAD